MGKVIEMSKYSQDNNRQQLYRAIASIVQNSTFSHQSEPYQGKTPLMPATVKNPDELWLYFARNGVLGRDAYLVAVIATSQEPILTNYLPKYSVANEALELSERKRNDSGTAHQNVHDFRRNFLNRKSFKKEPYRNEQYSHQKYASTSYLNSALRRGYTGIEEEVKKLFSRIRSIYQSASGMIRNRKRYAGRNETPMGNVVSLDAYREVRERRNYISTQRTLEQRVA